MMRGALTEEMDRARQGRAGSKARIGTSLASKRHHSSTTFCLADSASHHAIPKPVPYDAAVPQTNSIMACQGKGVSVFFGSNRACTVNVPDRCPPARPPPPPPPPDGPQSYCTIVARVKKFSGIFDADACQRMTSLFDMVRAHRILAGVCVGLEGRGTHLL